MGTVVQIRLPEVDSAVADPVFDQVFAEGERLQQIFSKFSPDSELNTYITNPSHRPSKEFEHLLNLSEEIQKASAGAFTHRLNDERRSLDFSGIAKGYVVDRMADILKKELGDISAEINAGGDLKFLGPPPYSTHVRLGGGPHPVLLRRLNSFLSAVASSSLSESIDNPNSTTIYQGKLRTQLSAWHTVTVLSESCSIADALTKVGLFSDKDWLQPIARRFQSQILVFSPLGELQESYG